MGTIWTYGRRTSSINANPCLKQGVEEKSISSSFTAAQWEEWLQKNVV